MDTIALRMKEGCEGSEGGFRIYDLQITISDNQLGINTIRFPENLSNGEL
jgi:hypothetical protein